MKISRNGYGIIGVHWKDGQDANYTMEIFSGLKQDKDCMYIYDPETGEVLWSRD